MQSHPSLSKLVPKPSLVRQHVVLAIPLINALGVAAFERDYQLFLRKHDREPFEKWLPLASLNSARALEFPLSETLVAIQRAPQPLPDGESVLAVTNNLTGDYLALAVALALGYPYHGELTYDEAYLQWGDDQDDRWVFWLSLQSIPVAFRARLTQATQIMLVDGSSLGAFWPEVKSDLLWNLITEQQLALRFPQDDPGRTVLLAFLKKQVGTLICLPKLPDMNNGALS